MPSLFKIGNYIVFFWSNENNEPIHVHITEGKPHSNATKIWLTKNGGCVLANNESRLPATVLTKASEVISAHYFFICHAWKEHFNVTSIQFYC